MGAYFVVAGLVHGRGLCHTLGSNLWVMELARTAASAADSP
jgi:hypothetical protein